MALFLINERQSHSLGKVYSNGNSSAIMETRTDLYHQKILFYSLYEFALRICYRYTGFKENPELPVYQGFLKLFRAIKKDELTSGTSSPIRIKFKHILIDTCLDIGKSDYRSGRECSEEFLCTETKASPSLQSLSSIEIIDALRMLSFPYRAVFNLSVMDGFGFRDISRKLQVPIHEAKINLGKAREKLRNFSPKAGKASSVIPQPLAYFSGSGSS